MRTLKRVFFVARPTVFTLLWMSAWITCGHFFGVAAGFFAFVSPLAVAVVVVCMCVFVEEMKKVTSSRWKRSASMYLPSKESA